MLRILETGDILWPYVLRLYSYILSNYAREEIYLDMSIISFLLSLVNTKLIEPVLPNLLPSVTTTLLAIKLYSILRSLISLKGYKPRLALGA